VLLASLSNNGPRDAAFMFQAKQPAARLDMCSAKKAGQPCSTSANAAAAAARTIAVLGEAGILILAKFPSGL
jgi:hypothetical protein